MYSFFEFFLQILHKDDKPADITDYINPTLAECQAINDHTYEAYLAVSMFLSLGRSIYGKLIGDLSNSYSMRTYQYPWTRANMHDTIVHWQNRAAYYGLHTHPGAGVFTQSNNNGPTSGKTHAKDGQRDPRDLSNVNCFK